MKIELPVRRDGKLSLKEKENDAGVIRVPDPLARPYREDTKHDMAWRVICCMDGLTVREGREILKKLEPNIERANGRPLGWIADCATKGVVEIHRPD